MAGGREIKTKIKSVQNTRKVTRALEMVSASKIRKAQERMKASRPYARMMRQIVGHLAKANTDYVHPYMVDRKDIKRVGYIVVSTDRGLCGAYNGNVLRKGNQTVKALKAAGKQVHLETVGKKAVAYFRFAKVDVAEKHTFGDKPQFEAVEALAAVPVLPVLTAPQELSLSLSGKG